MRWSRRCAIPRGARQWRMPRESRVERDFTVGQMVSRFEDAYDDLLR